jgi:hypothetical protein
MENARARHCMMSHEPGLGGDGRFRLWGTLRVAPNPGISGASCQVRDAGVAA